MRTRLLFLILFLSCIPFMYFFTTERLVHTHDGLVHVPRLGAFFKALLDLQIPVRWAGDLNYGYGVPLFVFIYHTPYLIGSFFLFFGLGLVFSFKLSLLVSFLLSGVFMYLFAKEFFKDEKKAFFVTLLYQFAPFHLVDVVVRGSFGEVYTYAFLPLVLFGLTKFFQKQTVSYFILISVAIAFLILSHNSISLLFFGIAALFLFFFAPSNRIRVMGGSAFLFGMICAAYYWVPALLEHKYTYGDLYMKDLYEDRFPGIWKFFLPNVTDFRELQTDSLSLQFGAFHTLSFIAAVVLFLLKKTTKNENKIIIFSAVLVAGSLFFMSTHSLVFWENLTFLRQFQFPWRFLAIAVFALSMLGIFLTRIVKNNTVFWILCVGILVSVISYWQPKEGFDTIDEKYYWNFPLNTTYYGETDVIWSAGPAKSYPKNRVEVIAGEAKIAHFTRQSNLQTLTVDAKKEATLVSHTQYFPGWRVYIDGKKETIEYQDQNYRGEITFPVSKGIHRVQIRFEESVIRLIADMISLFGLLGIVGMIAFRRRIQNLIF